MRARVCFARGCTLVKTRIGTVTLAETTRIETTGLNVRVIVIKKNNRSVECGIELFIVSREILSARGQAKLNLCYEKKTFCKQPNRNQGIKRVNRIMMCIM